MSRFKLGSVCKLLVMVALAALISSPAFAAKTSKGKFSTDVPPGHPKTVSFEKFAKIVKEKTDGRVDITVFPSSQLGGEMEAAEGMRLGSIQMGSITSSVLATWIPELQVIDMPFLFKNDEHAVKGLNWLAGHLAQKFDDQGFHLLGFSINGARQPGLVNNFV